MEFVPIPAGPFIMGNQADDERAWNDEFPSPYWAARFSVTNAAFQEFVQATGHVTRAEKEGWCWVWNSIAASKFPLTLLIFPGAVHFSKNTFPVSG
jgi:formylglycine-generating enzyme required for sulfatase activity